MTTVVAQSPFPEHLVDDVDGLITMATVSVSS
jgi:hypothetical protein